MGKLEVQRSCLHLCCRSFSRTLLKGFYHTQELAVHSPSHTHTHTQRERERERKRERQRHRDRDRDRDWEKASLCSHTRASSWQTGRPSRTFLLAEAKHPYPSNRRNSYLELISILWFPHSNHHSLSAVWQRQQHPLDKKKAFLRLRMRKWWSLMGKMGV
jgi:hypothetical protein